jgi:nucleotide-binding universal stress UspA family protein
LRLVAAIGWPTTAPQFSYPLPGPGPREDLPHRARAHLAEAVEAARAAAPGAKPEGAVLDGYPIPKLVAESRSAQLVVIGDRGLGGVAGLLVGSVAFGLAAHGACPTVVVRGRADAAAGPVVVGVDGSSVSEAAVAFAFEEATARRAPLVAVHVWWDLLLDPVTLPSLDWDGMAERERAQLAERLAGWREKYPDVAVELSVARDHPAGVLVEHARRAQLVVVGSHGRGGAAGLVLGSVSHAVLHRADCPVAIVRAAPVSG